jgi:hypothetical protein
MEFVINVFRMQIKGKVEEINDKMCELLIIFNLFK